MAQGQTSIVLVILLFAVLSVLVIMSHMDLEDHKKLTILGKFRSTLSPNRENIDSLMETMKKELEELERLKKQKEDEEHDVDDVLSFLDGEEERGGSLTCDGREIYSEVVYWKEHKGDRSYESPVTPHHSEHDEKFLSFEYDNGGWNNIRMSLECVVVVAHAMGRTLVVPPAQRLYLLDKEHKHSSVPKHDRSDMGFSDFFSMDVLGSHRGLHLISMPEFLEIQLEREKEEKKKFGRTNHLELPRGNTKLHDKELWHYLNKAADETPAWMGKFIIFPASVDELNTTFHLDNFTSSSSSSSSSVSQNKLSLDARQRLEMFANSRSSVHYNGDLQKARHIHIRGDDKYRVLQHHYAFAFFADPKQQSFYKRFIRDYMRYKDDIHCAGHELVTAVREEARKLDPSNSNGDYYAMHIRRGDFQFKIVKISAKEIITNLNISDSSGKPLIPKGALVYISTDDPDGLCKDCFVERKSCDTYSIPKPPGCPDDPSWKAFSEHGWNVRFLRDFLKVGMLKSSNPNTYGMIESIVCSRAKVFAGTYFSTFTGYIHRLRGFHGLGESTYYHYKDYVHHPRMEKSVGSGFSREWRAGWTDDGGELI